MTLSDWIKTQPYGECRRLADYLGVDRSQITHWLKGTRQVPIAHCPGIVAATRGQVTAHELRPDLDWLQIGADVFVKVGSMYNIKESK